MNMQAIKKVLSDNWVYICREIGINMPDKLLIDVFNNQLVKDGYDAPKPVRLYSTLNHVYEIWKAFNDLKFFAKKVVRANSINKETAKEILIAMEMSIYFHRIVFIPNQLDNKERSANIALTILSNFHARPLFVDNVSHCIKAMDHGNAIILENKIQQYIADIDLLGLAKPWDEFLRDQEMIREELGLSQEEFRDQRKRFFLTILAKKEGNVYYNQDIRERFERKAKENIWTFSESY